MDTHRWAYRNRTRNRGHSSIELIDSGMDLVSEIQGSIVDTHRMRRSADSAVPRYRDKDIVHIELNTHKQPDRVM